MGRHRLLVAVAGALGLLLALSGCVKLDMDLTIRSDDTVEGTVILAVDKTVLAASGQNERQLRDQLEKQGPFPASERPKRGKFSQHPYDKDGKIGEAYVFSGVPLKEFGNSGSGLKITHKGDRYLVSGQLDLTSGASTDPETQALAKQATSADLRIKITFPGEVLKSNGKIEGRSVTWHPKLGEKTELTAEARTTAVIPRLLGIAAAVVGLLLLIGLIALLLVLRRRRRARNAYAQQPVGYGPAGGYDPSYPPQHGGHGGPAPSQPGGYAAPYPQQPPSTGYGPAPSQPGGYAAPYPQQPPSTGYGPAPSQPGGYAGSPAHPSGQATPQQGTWGPPSGPASGPPSGDQGGTPALDRTRRLPVIDPTLPVPPPEPGQR